MNQLTQASRPCQGSVFFRSRQHLAPFPTPCQHLVTARHDLLTRQLTDPGQGRLASLVACFLVSWCLCALVVPKPRSENSPSDFAAGGVDRRGFPAVSSVVECSFAPGTEPGQGPDALTSRVWDFRRSPRRLAPREPDGWFGEIRSNRTARRKQPEEFRARSSVGRATDF